VFKAEHHRGREAEDKPKKHGAEQLKEAKKQRTELEGGLKSGSR
jgi:hypothetical protein